MARIDDEHFWTDFARRREAEWCEALATLLRFDTTSGDPSPDATRRWKQTTKNAYHFADDLARSHGFVVRNYDDRVLVIEMPGPTGAPVLGFPVHMDVVPAGEGWTRDPFGGTIADEAIWGRGAQDDKGPIVQTLFGLLGAWELARLSDRTFKKTVRIVIVSEEELGMWDDIPFYFERERPPDFSIVPDAHFPITNGEKGFVNLRVEAAWDEPVAGGLSIVSGERPNVVTFHARVERCADADAESLGALARAASSAAPRPADVAVEGGRWKADFHGIGAHGSTPEKGHGAAADALVFAASLGDVPRGAAGALGFLAEVARSLDGARLGIAARHEKVGATTVNLGVLRCGANGFDATLNIRNPIGLSCEEVERRARESFAAAFAALPGVRLARCERGPDSREPIYVDPARFEAWIGPMSEAYRAATGRDASLQSIGGTTFAKAFPNAVCFGPVDPSDGEPELAHQADERVTLAAMRRNVAIYGRTIAALCLNG